MTDGGSDDAGVADADEAAAEEAAVDAWSEIRLDSLSCEVGVAGTDEATPAKRPSTPSELPVLDKRCCILSALIAEEDDTEEDEAKADEG